MNTNIKHIILEERIFNFETILSFLAEKCLLKLNYEIDQNNLSKKELINANLFFIIEKINSDK